jgi:Ni2+-binding GTPase involved in maturation of urease and hydrogenase
MRGLNDKVEVIDISCATGQGIEKWLEWLKEQNKSPDKEK